MADLISVSPLGFKPVNFKNPLLTESTNRIYAIYQDVATIADAKNREIASILSIIKEGKTYEMDGFKSIAEYAEKTFGMKKQNAYSLASAGDIYNSSEASDSLKAFSPSKLAELSSLKPMELNEAIENGDIAPSTTQKELREYVKSKSPAKAMVLDTYTAKFIGETVDFNNCYGSTPKSLVDWDEWITQYFQKDFNIDEDIRIENVRRAMENPDTDDVTRKALEFDAIRHQPPTVEIQKLPKRKDGKKDVLRRVYITSTMAYVVEFYKYSEPVKKPSKKDAGLKYTREELMAMLAAMDNAEGPDSDEEPRPFD